MSPEKEITTITSESKDCKVDYQFNSEESPAETEGFVKEEVAVNNEPLFTEEELEKITQEYTELVSNMSLIEARLLMRRLKKYTGMLSIFNTEIDVSRINSSIVTEMANTILRTPDDILSPIFGKSHEDMEDPYDKSDIHDLKKEVVQYVKRVQILMGLALKRIEELKDKEVSVADEVIGALQKNLDTLKESTDVNAHLHIDSINKVIESIQNDEFIQASRMKNRMKNAKALLDLAKEFYKDRDKAIREIYDIGFNYMTVKSFYEFVAFPDRFLDPEIMEEILKSYKEPIEKKPEGELLQYTSDTVHDLLGSWLHGISGRYGYLLENPEKIVDVKYISAYVHECVLLFFYHIAKIVKTESKKQNCLSVIFKCYVIQTLELFEAWKKKPTDELRELCKEVVTTYNDIIEMYKPGYERYCKKITWNFIWEDIPNIKPKNMIVFNDNYKSKKVKDKRTDEEFTEGTAEESTSTIN